MSDAICPRCAGKTYMHSGASDETRHVYSYWLACTRCDWGQRQSYLHPDDAIAALDKAAPHQILLEQARALATTCATLEQFVSRLERSWQPVTHLEYEDPDADPTCWQYILYVKDGGRVIGLVDPEDEDNCHEITLPAHLRLCQVTP